MKRLLGLAGILMMTIAPVRADYQKGNQMLSLNVGSAGYSNDLKVNNGDNTLRDCGGSGGFQYLYVVSSGPTLGIGPDILWADFTEEDPSNVIAGGRSKSDAHTAVYQMVAKLAFPSGHWRPYVLGGVGGARSSLQSHITQSSGDVTKTFDSVRGGFAGTWGIGMDVFPREHWFFGLEFRQVLLSRLMHEPTSAGQALGIEHTRDPSSITSLLLKVGYKFGAN